ncbi:Cupredoxin [Echria macrotheca]|uniref:laccase n=1 Tax=Echria macrotheca TaxID=438768 RepID=A0AAJ0BFT3_9PEZI|nr:Cupredoxin [Echria macrotheca]
MRARFCIFLAVAIVVILAVAIPVIIIERAKTDRNTDVQGRPGTAASAEDQSRADWGNSFDISTDWEVNWPDTGVTRTYSFDIAEVDQFVGGDGVVKNKAMLINANFVIGPVIRANWGDRINVTVSNHLQSSGTSIHWHGFRQLNNNINDGTGGVTECPIPPGSSKTYTFQATQYGTSWYHSHISSQSASGLQGAIQIEGPASYAYDIDLGVFPISDWYYNATDQILNRVFSAANPFVPGQPGTPPPSDNVLFNGTNINPLGTGGNYAKIMFTPGKRHRLRLINAGVENTFTISIVGHSMTVIATDFVPVNPYPVDSVYLSVGQRLDVVIDANQPVGTYWLNATFSAARVCGSSNNAHPAAIVQYDGAPWWIPTDPGTAPKDTYCADDIAATPVVPRVAPIGLFVPDTSNTLNVSLNVDSSVSKVYWEVNSSAIDVTWDKPTLQDVLDGEGTFQTAQNIVEMPGQTQWTFWLIQNLSPVPHPMHLHGHDFIVIARSAALTNPLDPSNQPVTFNPAADAALLSQTSIPIRRDTSVLPAYGWMLVAFQTSNPGVWVFHCHIAWHVSQGLSVQFLERAAEIVHLMDVSGALGETCPAWKAWEGGGGVQKGDSGL